MALSRVPLELTLIAKVLAHWLTTGLPLIAAAPLIAILFNMPSEALPTLIAAMLLGTPTLSLIGSIGAALTLGARRGGILIPLLVLPLYIPTLIFGVSAVDAALGGFPVRPHLMMLGAILLISLVVSPLAGAAGLRQANE
jgi:heme exporter protein B